MEIGSKTIYKFQMEPHQLQLFLDSVPQLIRALKPNSFSFLAPSLEASLLLVGYSS